MRVEYTLCDDCDLPAKWLLTLRMGIGSPVGEYKCVSKVCDKHLRLKTIGFSGYTKVEPLQKPLI